MDRESLLVRRRLQVLLARDLEEAAVRSLEAYQERFPGHEEAVAEEYEAVLSTAARIRVNPAV